MEGGEKGKQGDKGKGRREISNDTKPEGRKVRERDKERNENKEAEKKREEERTGGKK